MSYLSPQPPLTTADAMRRIAGEMARLAHELRATEKTLFPIVIASGAAPPGSNAFAILQRFDRQMQSLDGLADILAEVSGSMAGGARQDVAEIVGRAKLAELSARLLGRSIEQEGGLPDFDLFAPGREE